MYASPMPPNGHHRAAYKNLLLVAGVLLLVLGTGNWITGAIRTRPYIEYLRTHPGPRTATGDLKTELLEPPDEEREERNVTRAKLQFYQLVQSGGRLMVVVGACCLLASLIDLTGAGSHHRFRRQ